MRQGARSFTLVEMIGVLAIVAIVLALVAPNVVRQIQTATATGEDARLDDIAQALTNAIRATGLIPNPNLDPATTNATGGYGWAYLASNYTRLAGDNLLSVFPGTTGDTRRRLYLSTDLARAAAAGGYPNTITNWGATFFPSSAKMYLVSASRPDFTLALPANGPGVQVSGNNWANPEVSSLDGWVKQFSGGKVSAPENIVGTARTNDGEFLHLRTIDLAAIFNETRAAQQKAIEQEDKNLEEIARALVAAIQATGQIPDPDVAPTAAGGWVTLAASYSSLGQDAFRYAFPAVSTNERRMYLDTSLTALPLATPAGGWASAPVSPASLFLVSSSKQDLDLACDANGPGANAAVSGQFNWLRTWSKAPGTNGQVAAANIAIVSWTNRGEFLHVKTFDLRSLFCRVELEDLRSPATVSVTAPGSGYIAPIITISTNGVSLNIVCSGTDSTNMVLNSASIVSAPGKNLWENSGDTNLAWTNIIPVNQAGGINGEVTLRFPAAPSFGVGTSPVAPMSSQTVIFYVLKGNSINLSGSNQLIQQDSKFQYSNGTWRQIY